MPIKSDNDTISGTSNNSEKIHGGAITTILDIVSTIVSSYHPNQLHNVSSSLQMNYYYPIELLNSNTNQNIYENIFEKNSKNSINFKNSKNKIFENEKNISNNLIITCHNLQISNQSIGYITSSIYNKQKNKENFILTCESYHVKAFLKTTW